MEIETLTPRLVSTVAWFLSERLDGLLLMLFEILLTHRAQNNVNFVPGGTAHADQFSYLDPLSLIPVIPFYAEIQGMRETIETPARDRISL